MADVPPGADDARPAGVSGRLAIRERTVQGVVILALDGALVAPGAPIEVRDRINLLAFEGARSIALDLDRLRRLDAAGVRTLAAARETMRRCDGDLKLLRVPEHMIPLLTTPPLAAFETHDTETALVRSFVLPAAAPVVEDRRPGTGLKGA